MTDGTLRQDPLLEISDYILVLIDSSSMIRVGIALGDVVTASGPDVFASKGVVYAIKTAAAKSRNEDKVRSELQTACCNKKIYSYKQMWQ